MATRSARKRGLFSKTGEASTSFNDASIDQQNATTGSVGVKKVAIKLVVDKSKESIGIKHYLAMFLWLGWPSFYLALMLTLPFLYLYARPLLIAILLMLTTSAIYPLDSRKQPKVFCLVY